MRSGGMEKSGCPAGGFTMWLLTATLQPAQNHNISRNPQRDGEGRRWMGVNQWRYGSSAIFCSTATPAGIIISPLYLAGEI